ncbi:TadE/TadG family type IV pilus assembly protein [Acetivibrio cellulolyticus]|uniref:TadE/TadG family type IV pilus assembly protein n=1 Tax=Acetivibrio cellulolyticus TaxID=35830 RepID=UPI0001E2C2CC|nr:TadE family protein [Acetivibrio cellulolyticus]
MIRKFNNNKGSQTLEFVMLSPILIFILFGVIILGLTIFSWVIVADSAREASRAEALGLASADVKAEEVLKGSGLNTDSDRLTIEKRETDNYVTVKVSYKQPTFVPMLPVLFGGDAWDDYFIVSAKSQFKKETE